MTTKDSKKVSEFCIRNRKLKIFSLTDQLYEGELNFLQQRIVLISTFQCQFDLSFYPFDTQTCKLIMKAVQPKTAMRFQKGQANFMVKSTYEQ